GVAIDGLYERTGGNPFFVTEVLAAGGQELPESVRGAVLARVARLGPGAAHLLEAVAVVPASVDLPLLEAMAGDCPGALDECLASGMLVFASDRAGFRHELARLAVESTLSPRRRVQVHRQVLRALGRLTGLPPDPALLCHHAIGARDPPAVVAHAPPAARLAASRGAHRQAAEHLRAALVYRALLPPEQAAALLAAYARECYLTA